MVVFPLLTSYGHRPPLRWLTIPSTANIARISLMEYTQPMWCRRCVENRRWQLVIGWVGFCIVLCLALLSHGGVLWWYWCDISLIDRLLWAGWRKVHQSIHIVVPGASFKDVLLQRLIMILLWLAIAKQHKRSHCGDKRIWWSSYRHNGISYIVSIWRCYLTSIGNLIVEIRRSLDHLISTMVFPILIRLQHCINSLGSSDAIWRWRFWSTLVQVMAWCLMAPSNYLNRCWLVINKFLWHSSEDIIIRRFEDINLQSKIENYIFKITLRSPRGLDELKKYMRCVNYNTYFVAFIFS